MSEELLCTKCDKKIEAETIEDVTYVRHGNPFCSNDCANHYVRDPNQLELPFDLKPAEATGYMNY